MWLVAKLLFNAVLFVSCAMDGISALYHHRNAGYLVGFVLCSTGHSLFGTRNKGLLEQVFAEAKTK
jgi:hypothetical protein